MSTTEVRAWNGDAAMARCDTAAEYRSICAGEHTYGDPDERRHWALPHHDSPGAAANPDGVRAARARFGSTEQLQDREAVRRHLFETHSLPSDEGSASDLPRDGLIRSVAELQISHEDEPRMRGHFVPFNEWTEIDSVIEGHFMERMAPGAFTKTFAENGDRIRVLLNHGNDPELGMKPIGQIEELEEDDVGARYTVRLFEGLPQIVREGIEAEQYGASFKFRVMHEEKVPHPKPSEHNPDGIPERTVKEARVFEFGPTPFGAYAGATSGIRSLTDEFIFARISQGEGLRKFAEYARTILPDAGAATEHPDAETSEAGPDHPERIATNDYTGRRTQRWLLNPPSSAASKSWSLS